MMLLFLLLPIAAFSGWYVCLKTYAYKSKLKKNALTPKYFSGLNYLLNEQPDKAVDAFLQVLDIDDEIVEIQLMLGNLFRRKGEVDRAIKIHQGLLFKPLLPCEYQNILILELAKDYVSAGLLDRAEKILLELVENGSELEASLNLLNKIYQDSKDWLKAIDVILKLQEVCGKDFSSLIAHYYCELAKQAVEINNILLAKKYIKQALGVDSNCARASIILGDIEFYQQNYKTSLKVFKKVYFQKPDCLSEVISKILLCYKKLDKYKGMNEYWQKILNENPHITLIISYTEFLQQTQNDEVALEYLTKYLYDNPSILGLSKVIQLNLHLTKDKIKSDLHYLYGVIEKIIQNKCYYRCSNCGLSAKILEWQCPSCKKWDTFRILSCFQLS